MLKRVIPVLLAASALALAAVACGAAAAELTPTSQRPSPPPPPRAPTPERVEMTATPTRGDEPVTEITVNLVDERGQGPYSFDPAEFSFQEGEWVKLTLVGEAEFHTFTVDDLGIDAEVDAGQTLEIEFLMDQPGTFELICIPHELQGMVGTITVAPSPDAEGEGEG